jgi:hypothetical protein
MDLKLKLGTIALGRENKAATEALWGEGRIRVEHMRGGWGTIVPQPSNHSPLNCWRGPRLSQLTGCGSASRTPNMSRLAGESAYCLRRFWSR